MKLAIAHNKIYNIFDDEFVFEVQVFLQSHLETSCGLFACRLTVRLVYLQLLLLSSLKNHHHYTLFFVYPFVQVQTECI